MPVDFKKLDAALAPLRRSESLKPGKHFVEFYEDDGALVESVRTFLSAGLNQGESAIIIATQAHRDDFERALVDAGVDVDAAVQTGRYHALDAEETLALFMVAGVPNAERFDDVIGGLLTKIGSPVRLFGEMVAVLWTEGNVAGAIQVEELWNELAAAHPFKLFCAYNTDEFSDQHVDLLREVCQQHSHVIRPHP